MRVLVNRTMVYHGLQKKVKAVLPDARTGNAGGQCARREAEQLDRTVLGLLQAADDFE